MIVDREAEERRAIAERAAQGLPPTIEDESVLARIAAVMRQVDPKPEPVAKRRRRRRAA